ncbi:MAG: DUF1570 domain-containing protein [Planctomycetota bacterium]|jgi:hypothetical protein
MKRRVLVFIFLFIIAALLIPSPALFADTVVKKDGRRIEGKILEENMDWVVIRTKFGEAKIFKDDIKQVIYGKSEGTDQSGTAEKSPPKKLSYEERVAEAEKKDTAEAWVELAEWCRKNGRKPEAEKAFRNALELDPDNATARKALGFVKIAGKWMTENEARTAGYVRNSKGKWVSEKDLAEEERKHIEQQRKLAAERRKERQKELEGVPWAQHFSVTSAHYELHCNVTKDITDMYLRVMEALYKKYMKVFAALDPSQKRPCKVHIHRNQQEFQQTYNSGAGGFYSSGQHALFCYHGNFGMTGSTLTVLAHEGCHQFQHMFMGGRMMSSPIWVLEGMAVVFESSDIDAKKGSVELVGLNPDRIRNLQSMMKRGKHVTLKEMLNTPQSGFNASHYCTAGTFTWWLLKDSKKKKYRKLYEKYLLDIVEGRTGSGRRRGGGGYSADDGKFASLAEEITGKTIAELEEEWKEYVMKLEVPRTGKFTGDKFVSRQYGFEVKKPSKNWKPLDENELSQAQVICWEKKRSEARLRIYAMRNSVNASPERDLATFERELAYNRRYSDFKLFHKKRTFVGGYDAAEFFYQIRNPSSSWNKKLIKSRRTTVYADRLVYYVIASCSAEKWDENLADFDKIRDSFLVTSGR